MRVNGFDGKLVLNEKNSFKTLLGIGVTIDNYPEFIKRYDLVIDEVFKQNGLERTRLIYKSSDLQNIFYGFNVDIIPILAEKLIELISFIDIYYYYFNPAFEETKNIDESLTELKNPTIGSVIEKEGKIGVFYNETLEYLTPVQFLDLINNHFPAICCFTYMKCMNNQPDSIYFIDHCPGLLHSPAVESVIKNRFTKFLFNGDKVNYAISSADIICRYIELICHRKNIRFNKEMIERAGLNKEKFQTTYIGPKWFYFIKPTSKKHLDVSHKYPHPIIFFFNNPESSFGKQTKEVIEKSILYRRALEFAAKRGGSVKFFEPGDQDWINADDFLIFHDDLSKKRITELKNLSCPAEVIDNQFFK